MAQGKITIFSKSNPHHIEENVTLKIIPTQLTEMSLDLNIENDNYGESTRKILVRTRHISNQRMVDEKQNF